MKNIHVLPTEKPSRLYKRIDLSTFHLGDFDICKTDDTIRTNQHIYITSDEEIKEDEYYLSWQDYYNPSRYVIYVKSSGVNGDGKKIILTTDQDLIADGVQSIDDTFLEWFVKNPTCEFVEVEKTFVTNSGLGYQEYAILDSDFKVLEVVANRPQSSYKIGEVTELDGYEYITEYKIIIPQEEPYDRTYQPIILSDIDKEEEPKHIPYTGKVWEPPVSETLEESKQETLEEFYIKREFPKHKPKKDGFYITDYTGQYDHSTEWFSGDCFINYSGGVVDKKITWFLEKVERNYTEEEVGELVYTIIGQYARHYGIMIDGAKLNELFEQFKKE